MRSVLVPANAHEDPLWNNHVLKEFRADDGDIVGIYGMLVSSIGTPSNIPRLRFHPFTILTTL